ncbi:MAG: hypothetical protein ABIQ95_00245 [Bdellovibrionia bacterium]
MKKSFKVTPDEFHLLMQEIVALGETFKDERLKRREAIDNLNIQVMALRQTLTHFHPDFDHKYSSVQTDLIHRFDPETGAFLNDAGKSDDGQKDKIAS